MSPSLPTTRRTPTSTTPRWSSASNATGRPHGQPDLLLRRFENRAEEEVSFEAEIDEL